MTRLDRYLLAELAPPFFGGLLVMTLILLLDRLFDLMEMIFRKGLSVGTVAEVFGLSLPFMLALTVPMAVLIAVLVTFGRLAADFEILALKSLGVSTLRILRAPLAAAVVVFGIMAVFNNTVLPEANHKLKNLLIDIAQKKPTVSLEERVFNRLGDQLLYIGRKDDRTNRIYDVLLEEKTPEGVRTIFADSGRMGGKKDEYLILDLYHGEVHEAPRETTGTPVYRIVRFQKQRVVIPINSKLVHRDRSFRTDREMNVLQLLAEVRRTQESIKHLPRKDPVALKFKRRRISQLWVEIHKKFSIPFAAIVFVLLGAPLAMRMRRGGYGTAFGIAFLIFTVYYIFLIGGEELADRALVPAGSVWFPNLLLGAIGVYLLWQET